MSYNSDSIKDMIECLDKHKYSYTQYKHKNGYCNINSDVLLEQLKINEQEIRAKAIDEFAKWCYVNGIDFSYMRKSTDIEPFVKTVIKRFNKEQLKAGGKNE